MTAKKGFTILVNIHLEHLIGEVSVLRKFVENKPEELTLKVEIETARRVDANKSGMKSNVCIFAGRSGSIGWPAEVVAVIRDKGPIAFKDRRL
jgi:hypothetical protein